jgi:hypothetical protein
VGDENLKVILAQRLMKIWNLKVILAQQVMKIWNLKVILAQRVMKIWNLKVILTQRVMIIPCDTACRQRFCVVGCTTKTGSVQWQ